MPFVLPTNGLIFTDHIIDRSKDLISHHIWQGISELQLDTWIKNFQNDKQRYFAARILDILIYRSEPQTLSMLTHMFQRTIPDLAEDHTLFASPSTVYDRLRASEEPDVRIVPVSEGNQAQMSSGPLVGRLLRRHLGIHRHWIISHHDIRPSTPFVIFIDDFIGTGNQFSRFIREENLVNLISEQRCCYVSITAHVTGIGKLSCEFPDLAIASVDELSERNSLFSEEGLAFPDGTNSVADAKAFYDEMLSSLDIDSRFHGGFGSLNLAYAFDHAVPNNSTPLLWWSNNDSWSPLFPR